MSSREQLVDALAELLRAEAPTIAREIVDRLFSRSATLSSVTLIRQGSWSYTFSPEDRLWTARMLAGEGPASDAPAVLWTMAQLFTPAGQKAKYGNETRFRTFTGLIQAYSQPINPIWRRDGSKCRPGGSHHGTDACSESRLARRDAFATLAYNAVAADKRAVLEGWLEGKVPNPLPGAIDFAHVSVIPDSRRARQPVLWTSPTGNQFLSAPASALPFPATFVGPKALHLDDLTPFGRLVRDLLG